MTERLTIQSFIQLPLKSENLPNYKNRVGVGRKETFFFFLWSLRLLIRLNRHTASCCRCRVHLQARRLEHELLLLPSTRQKFRSCIIRAAKNSETSISLLYGCIHEDG